MWLVEVVFLHHINSTFLFIIYSLKSDTADAVRTSQLIYQMMIFLSP